MNRRKISLYVIILILVALLALSLILWQIHIDRQAEHDSSANLTMQSLHMWYTPFSRIVNDIASGQKEVQPYADELQERYNCLSELFPKDERYPTAKTFLLLSSQFGEIFTSVETVDELPSNVLYAAWMSERALHTVFSTGEKYTQEELLAFLESNEDVNLFVDKFAAGRSQEVAWPNELS